MKYFLYQSYQLFIYIPTVDTLVDILPWAVGIIILGSVSTERDIV